MNIDDIEFQTGDLLLFSGNPSIVSRVIEFFTGSIFSHVAIVIKDPQFTSPPLKGLYILESGLETIRDSENHRYKFGAQIVPLYNIINKYEGTVYYRKLNCERNDNFCLKLAEAHSNVHNEPYDIDPIDMIKAVLDIYDGNNQKQTEYWCSALVGYIYSKLGFLPKDIPWTLLTPQQFSSNNTKKSNSLHFTNCTLGTDVKIIKK